MMKFPKTFDEYLALAKLLSTGIISQYQENLEEYLMEDLPRLRKRGATVSDLVRLGKEVIKDSRSRNQLWSFIAEEKFSKPLKSVRSVEEFLEFVSDSQSNVPLEYHLEKNEFLASHIQLFFDAHPSFEQIQELFKSIYTIELTEIALIEALKRSKSASEYLRLLHLRPQSLFQSGHRANFDFYEFISSPVHLKNLISLKPTPAEIEEIEKYGRNLGYYPSWDLTPLEKYKKQIVGSSVIGGDCAKSLERLN